MNNAIIQLLILAAVAVFLVFRLKNLLGTREGFEKSTENTVVKIKEKQVKSPNLEIINGGLDHDILDKTGSLSKAAKSLQISYKNQNSMWENFYLVLEKHMK